MMVTSDAAALAAFVFLVFVLFFLVRRIAFPDPKRGKGAWRGAKYPANSIVVDGSNVMHWNGEPSERVLQRVVQTLIAKDLTPLVVFDANVGYKLKHGFMNSQQMAGLLGLSRKQVIVVSKGEPADETILRIARKHDYRIVTNDRFLDWSVQFPLVKQKRRLIKGRWRQGNVTLQGI